MQSVEVARPSANTRLVVTEVGQPHKPFLQQTYKRHPAPFLNDDDDSMPAQQLREVVHVLPRDHADELADAKLLEQHVAGAVRQRGADVFRANADGSSVVTGSMACSSAIAQRRDVRVSRGMNRS